jgi:hypothetical protein
MRTWPWTRWAIYAMGLPLILLCSPGWAEDMAVWKEVMANRDCGVNCLLVACKLFGKDGDKREMATLARLGPNGTNFQNLADAARQKGLFCKGVRWNLASLRRWDGLAIAHYGDSHFVLVKGFQDPQTIHVIDPPHTPQLMKAVDFCKAWDGKVLLLSDRPIPLFAGFSHLLEHTLGALLGLLTALIGGAFLVRISSFWKRRVSSGPDTTRSAAGTLMVLVIGLLAASGNTQIVAKDQGTKEDTGHVTLGDGSPRTTISIWAGSRRASDSSASSSCTMRPADPSGSKG